LADKLGAFEKGKEEEIAVFSLSINHTAGCTNYINAIPELQQSHILNFERPELGKISADRLFHR